MPPKRKVAKKPTDSKEISTFFKPDTSKSAAGRKREASDQPAIAPNEDCPPPSKRQADITSDQQKIIEQKKLSAEAKLWAKKLGAGEIGESWMIILSVEFKKPYFTTLSEFIQKEREGGTVYPPATDVFSWTTTCALENIKVVIVGQDPYHGPNQAHGLCFSVCVGVQPPPSLVNIFKELQNSIEGFKIPDHGYLMGWAKQGVLLLNACLTVRAKQPKSHAGKGWEKLTDAVINWINIHLSGIIFLLWGADAQKKGAVINQSRHHVLKTVHPSPLSANRGFFGCNHFFKTNELLKQEGKDPIDWDWLPKSV